MYVMQMRMSGTGRTIGVARYSLGAGLGWLRRQSPVGRAKTDSAAPLGIDPSQNRSICPSAGVANVEYLGAQSTQAAVLPVTGYSSKKIVSLFEGIWKEILVSFTLPRCYN